ncbi:MAG: GtrA family protein [Sulfolobaceae archaeon]|nr:GtrA family protein [Sulfolobaceae archaeon]
MKREELIDFAIRMIKFAIVGALGTIVNDGIFVVSVRYLSVIISLLIAIEISILFNFSLNDIWTFKDRRNDPLINRLLKFHGSSLSGAVIQFIVVILLLIWLLKAASVQVALQITFSPIHNVSSIMLVIINTIGIIAGFIIRFLTSFKYVWRKKI